MAYKALKHKISTRGIPPDRFLDELVAWGKTVPEDIFVENHNLDIYSNATGVLGRWGRRGTSASRFAGSHASTGRIRVLLALAGLAWTHRVWLK
jgi:hypothetical protein